MSIPDIQHMAVLECMKSLGWTTKNKALISAFTKGMEARKAGKPATANPYNDVRNYRGMITFSRSFYRYWNRGWEGKP